MQWKDNQTFQKSSNKNVSQTTIGIQTLNREENTQTDPYTPEEIITEETDKELLQIKHFKWGKELPASIQ